MDKQFPVEPFEYEDEHADQPRLDSWHGLAPGFRARRRRIRAAYTDPARSMQRVFDGHVFPVHLDGEGAGASTGVVAPSAAPRGPGARVSTGATIPITTPPRLGTLHVTAPRLPPFSYTFTPEDLVWTARFLVGEAGGADSLDNAAVIWAMFNRFGLFTHSLYGAFHKFLRAYSTPLQSVLHSAGAARRHMLNPTFVRAGGSYPGTSIPRGQLQRFLELQNRPWNQLPRAARALATRALRGGVPNPIGNATEFASTAVYFHDRYGKGAHLDDATWRDFTKRYAATKQWTWIGDVPGLNQRNNAFFVDHRVAALPPGAVRVSP